MANELGSGVKLKAGTGKETAWGDLIAPDEFLPITPGESVKDVIEWLEKNVLKGKSGREAGDISGKHVAGTINLEANYQAIDRIWALLMGGGAGLPSGTGPFVHTISKAEDPLRSLSLHLEKDVNVWSINGIVINSLSLGCGPDGVNVACDVVGKGPILQATTHRAALAALTDPEKPRLMFHQAVVRIGDLADALADGDKQEISNWTWTWNNSFAVDHRTVKSGYFRAQPRRSGWAECTLSITLPRYEADTILEWHKNQTKLQCDITFTNGNYIFKIQMPTLYIKDCDGNAGDEGIIPLNATLQAYRNSGNTFITETEEAVLSITNDRGTAIWA
jgi:hypothetical protein